MTTVMLKTDEELLAQASDVMARQNLSLAQFWEKALRDVVAGEERVRRYDAMMEGFRALGVGPFPEMTREERNARL